MKTTQIKSAKINYFRLFTIQLYSNLALQAVHLNIYDALGALKLICSRFQHTRGPSTN